MHLEEIAFKLKCMYFLMSLKHAIRVSWTAKNSCSMCHSSN